MSLAILIPAAIILPIYFAGDAGPVAYPTQRPTPTPKETLASQIPTKPVEPSKEPSKPPEQTAGPPRAVGDDKVPTGMMSLAAVSTNSKVDGLELTPAETTIPSTKRFIIISAKAASKVKWFVTNTSSQQPVEWLEIPNTKSVMVFPNYDSDDKVSIYAYTVINGEPSDLAKASIIVVKRTAPIPIPMPEPSPPGPKPLPAGAKLHLTIISDTALQKANPNLASVIDSKVLNDKINARKHNKWVLDQNTDQDIIKAKGFDEFLKKVNKVPIFIVQDDSGKVLEFGALPTSVDNLITILDRISAPTN